MLICFNAMEVVVEYVQEQLLQSGQTSLTKLGSVQPNAPELVQERPSCLSEFGKYRISAEAMSHLHKTAEKKSIAKR